MNKLNKYKFFRVVPLTGIIGLLFGILGGFLYYSEIGCKTGTCAITSNPWLSMLWGGMMGYLLFGMFQSKAKAAKKDDE